MEPGTLIEPILAYLLALLPRLAVALLVFLVFLWLANWAGRVVNRILNRQAKKLDPTLIILFTRLTRWSIAVVGIISAVETLGVNVTGLLAGLGIVGLTVGFALQDIAKNFTAGLLLMIQQPFQIGDTIEVKGFGGTVKDISLRATEMLTFDGLYVMIPNADVFINPITNYSKINRRRVSLTGSVAYGVDLELATRSIMDAIRRLPGIVTDKPLPSVVFNQLTDSVIRFTLHYWIDLGQTDFGAAQDGGLKLTQAALAHEGIASPSVVPPPSRPPASA